jgi:hypothetical protein
VSREITAPSLAMRAHRTPLGVLLLAAVLGVIGTTSLVAGAYVTLSGGTRWLGPGLVGVVIGPAVLHLAWKLIYRARWAWVAMLAVTGMLFLSSLARLVFTPEAAGAAMLEILGEAVLAWYLTRPRIRGHFSE